MTTDTTFELVFDSSNLRKLRARAVDSFLKAARDTVRDVGKEYERALEGATEAAGLGRLAKAWNSTVYPKTGLANAPSVSIYPKGKTRTLGAIIAYAKGAEIKGTRGQLLAIPLPAAGPRATGRGAARVGLTPAEWERRTGLKLRLIPGRRGKPGLLVLDEARVLKSGRARLETQRRRDAGKAKTAVPIFVLVKQVNVKKRFDIGTVLRSAPGRLQSEFIARANALANSINPEG